MTRPGWDEPAASTRSATAARAHGEGAPATPGEALPDAARFTEVGLLGEGSGGRIVRAIDHRLGREVALKIVDGARPDLALASARLRREAAILAALEHPGIVPIYDLGPRPDGGLQLALRIVRGETLDALLRAAPAASTARRRRLAADVLGAAEAIAYAHAKGVVHRDLKPANLMVGEFDDIQVIDWGLAIARVDAATRAVPDASRAALDAAMRDDPDLTHAGAVIGTPRYMSPAAARGEPLDARADVWALGAILYEVLVGRPAFPHAVTADALAAIRDVRVPPLDLPAVIEVAPGLPAVLARALCGLERRFPDAGAFADALRTALAPRARTGLRALAVAGAVGLAVTVALVARGGDREATAPITTFASAPSPTSTPGATPPATDLDPTLRASLGRAHAVEAQRLVTDGAVPEALAEAARALALTPDPEAFGVLAATGRAGHPELERARPVPRCEGLDLAPDGAHWLCRQSDAVRLYASDADTPLWRAPGRARAALFSDDGRVVVVIGDLVRGPDLNPPPASSVRLTAAVTVLDLAGHVVARTAYRNCDGAPTSAGGGELAYVPGYQCLVALGRGEPVFMGFDRRIHRSAVGRGGRAVAIGDDGEVLEAQLDLTGSSTSGAPVFAHFARTDLAPRIAEVQTILPIGRDRVAIGTTLGEVLVVSRATADGERPIEHLSLPLAAPIVALSASPSGALLVALSDRGGPMLVATEPLALRAQLPVGDAGLVIARDDDQLISLATRLGMWRVGPARVAALTGLTGLDTLVGDARRAAVGYADCAEPRTECGTLATFDLDRGVRLARKDYTHRLKALALGPDRALAVVGLGNVRPARLDLDTLAPLPFDDDVPHTVLSPARRVGVTATGRVLIVRYSSGVELATAPDGHPQLLLGESTDELDVAGTRAAFLLHDRKELALFETEPAPVELARCPDPDAVAIGLSADGADLLGVHADAIVAWSSEDCGPVRVYRADAARDAAASRTGPLTIAQASADGRFVAAGSRAGRVFVWDARGELVLALTAHAARVAALTFDPRATVLMTGGWDGVLRVLDLTIAGLDDADRAAAAARAARAIDDAYGLTVP